MWHEARKQEKKIRGMIVDYKRRAERRREFYEKTVSSKCLLAGHRPFILNDFSTFSES
jgi:hypothetical protein